jgi:hypothetical protein
MGSGGWIRNGLADSLDEMKLFRATSFEEAKANRLVFSS